MSNQLRLRLDDPRGASSAVRKQATELVDDFVGIETNGFGVVANKRAGEDARRPLREVVALQSKPEIGAAFRDGHYRFDADAAPFPFASKAGTKGISVRHADPGEEQRSSRTISHEIFNVRRLCSRVQLHFCNRLVRFDDAFVNEFVLRLKHEA